MRMTIDESLEWLISRKEHYEMDDNCQELAKALDTAIETMRKYQKIAQVIKDWESDRGWALEMSELYWLDRVKEVIEDGKVD